MFERFTTAARETVKVARDEAIAANRTVGTEHLLVALLETDRGPAYRVLTESGVTAESVRADAARLAPTPAAPLGPEDAQALKAIGIDLDAVIAHVESTFGAGALSTPDDDPAGAKRGLFGRRKRGPAAQGAANPRFTPRSKKVLELSLREALHRGDDYIGAEHILLGLIRDGDGLAAKILTDAGLTLDGLRTRLTTELGKAA